MLIEMIIIAIYRYTTLLAGGPSIHMNHLGTHLVINLHGFIYTSAKIPVATAIMTVRTVVTH